MPVTISLKSATKPITLADCEPGTIVRIDDCIAVVFWDVLYACKRAVCIEGREAFRNSWSYPNRSISELMGTLDVTLS